MSRFVFDPKSSQKKKLNKVLKFPPSLDLKKYLSKNEKPSSKNLSYTLKGVLLHKGTSAYSGHYVCYVYHEKCLSHQFFWSILACCQYRNTSRDSTWYFCDDESVERVGPQLKLGSPTSQKKKKPKGKSVEDTESEDIESESSDFFS